MYDSKVLLVVVILIVLLLTYFYFKSGSGKEKAVGGKKKKNKGKLSGITSYKGKHIDVGELYDQFHERFVQGINMEDFQREYDDDDGVIYIKLKQLYKLGKDTPQVNLLRDITVDDYNKVLED